MREPGNTIAQGFELGLNPTCNWIGKIDEQFSDPNWRRCDAFTGSHARLLGDLVFPDIHLMPKDQEAMLHDRQESISTDSCH
jgi:hypothetical protein